MIARRLMLFLIVVSILMLGLAACGGGMSESQSATATALSIKLAAPEEAAPETPQPSDVDAGGEQPGGADAETAVDPSTPDPELESASATGTARAIELQLTSDAASVENAASEAATVAALAPIQEELATYGFGPDSGKLGWTHPPIVLEVTDFEDYDFANQNLFTLAKDFVLAADVTWNSRFAESGCGFVVRSDGEEENPNQYIVGLTRGAQGHVLFAEQIDGDVDLNDVTDIYANGIDPLFEWQNDTTNRIAIVGQGQDFTLYSNGTRLGTVTGEAGFEDGFTAFITINRSGGIRCAFDNAWLWRLN